MNKFIISGMIVICVAMGIIFVKTKKVNNDREPLHTPLSSIKPRNTPSLKEAFPPEAMETIKNTVANPPIVEKKAAAANGMAMLSKSKQTPKLISTKALKVINIPLPPKIVATDHSIQNIQRELQSVIELNKKINSVQTKKTTQLLRIQEQVLIQQKILDDIQSSAEQTSEKSSPSREALLAQEKLKIIHEETLKSKKILDEEARSKISP